jgi:branched-subunit amino acid transport protein
VSAGAALVALALAGLGNWLLRASFIAFIDASRMPHLLERALAHSRPAILAALVTSAATRRLGASPDVAVMQVLALGVAALVSWRTHNLTWTLLAGVAVLVVGDYGFDLLR